MSKNLAQLLEKIQPDLWKLPDRRIFRWADRNDIEDGIQNFNANFLNKQESWVGENRGQLLAYALMYIKNYLMQCRDRRRNMGIMPGGIEEATFYEQQQSNTPLPTIYLRNLTPAQREAVELFTTRDTSLHEMAKILGITYAPFYRRLQRALVSVRTQLQKDSNVYKRLAHPLPKRITLDFSTQQRPQYQVRGHDRATG